MGLRALRGLQTCQALKAGLIGICSLWLLAACSPALDWRDARSADGALMALLPCKPQLHERRVSLAGRERLLSMKACAAGAHTWALSVVSVDDPAQTGPVLQALAAGARANLGLGDGAAKAPGPEPRPEPRPDPRPATAAPTPATVPGATPHPESRRLVLQGLRPDGAAVQMHLALFVRGTQVYQATVLGPGAGAEAIEVFFSSLRLGA